MLYLSRTVPWCGFIYVPKGSWQMAQYKATIMDSVAVERALRRISHEILEKNGGSENLCLVGIKRRGVPIAEIIAENISSFENVKIPVGNLDITFYRDDLEKAFEEPDLKMTQIPFDITGKTVILVDDVLFTGRTARAAMEGIMKHGRAAAIRLAVLIDRGHRELPIRGDYVGKNVPTSKTEGVSVRIPPYDDITAVELYG